MKNQVFHYTKEQVFEHAKDFFIASCNFDLSKPRHQKMMNEALGVLEKEKHQLDLKAVCSRLGKDAYIGGKVKYGDTEISCNGFSRVADEHVLEVYICVITAGDWYIKDEVKVRYQVYIDTWGTAFVDGTKVLVEEQLKSMIEDGQYLSDPFGPGYYGMASSDTHKFSEIVDMSTVGVEVRESGIMVPLKTMAAIYLVTENVNTLPPMACSECFGKVDGCKFCNMRKWK